MSRTFRLRHLPQPEGGSSAHRFTDSRLRHALDIADEGFVFHLAHLVLKLPCTVELPENSLVSGDKAPLYVGWKHSHARCLTPELRDLLWSLRCGSVYWTLGSVRTMCVYHHPYVGMGLWVVPSSEKKYARKQVYRYARRRTKRLLRLVEAIRYLDDGSDVPCVCEEPFCELGGVPELRWTHGTEIDPDEMNFNDEYSVKAGLARSAWALTW